MNPTQAVRYSFVVPVFNEEAVLPVLVHRLDRLMQDLDGPAEAIFVDDGSTDCSPVFLRERAKRDPRFRYIALSRNFGHQAAISAGMDAASGEAIVVMDADLQDPPEVVAEMIARWHEGYEIVHGRRLTRHGESRWKTATASLFYRLLAKVSSVEIPRDAGDFRLVDRKVLNAFRHMPERDRFVRGMFAWLGFRQTEVAFHRPPRLAGKTKYPFFKMAKLATHGVLSFSDTPLRLAIWCGVCISLLAMAFGAGMLALKIGGYSHLVQGWTSMVVVISFLCGLNMLMTGLVGLYVGRIHTEVKGRPLYVVAQSVGFGEEHAASNRDAATRGAG